MLLLENSYLLSQPGGPRPLIIERHAIHFAQFQFFALHFCDVVKVWFVMPML